MSENQTSTASGGASGSVLDLPVGTRLRMTSYALEQGLQGRKNRRTGVKSSAHPRTDECLRVLVDGAKEVKTYHAAFWEVDDTPNKD